PLAKVKSKNNTNKEFKELSIFISLYKLLVVSEWILQNGIITPFLDSSLGNINLGDAMTSQIYIVSCNLPVARTSKLLNQHMKRCLNNSW
ncbi:hypothetical protein BCV71DRAFT_158902, partial [Rhizopus microsporus]